jgi:hypothetical protein
MAESSSWPSRNVNLHLAERKFGVDTSLTHETFPQLLLARLGSRFVGTGKMSHFVPDHRRQNVDVETVQTLVPRFQQAPERCAVQADVHARFSLERERFEPAKRLTNPGVLLSIDINHADVCRLLRENRKRIPYDVLD